MNKAGGAYCDGSWAGYGGARWKAEDALRNDILRLAALTTFGSVV